MNCIAVLAHLMSKNGVLSEESAARANLAISRFKRKYFDYLFTSGWAYRVDCPTPISDALSEFIINHTDISKSRIISIPLARDTVGDAIFLRQISEKLGVSELEVVTSDYHAARTKTIFEKIMNGKIAVDIVVVETKKRDDKKTLEKEQLSISTFEETFSETDFTELHKIIETIVLKHPYYNGEIHPKFDY